MASKKNNIRHAAALLAAALAAPAWSLGLVEAYELALRNDPAWRSALREHEAGQQAEPLGRSHVMPQVSATYAPSRNRADVTNEALPGSPTDERRYSALSSAIQLRQPLFHPEGMARWRQGQAQAAGSDAQLAFRSQELVLRVASLYTFAKYAEDQLATAVAQREAFSAQRVANQRMFQRGEGTRTDVLESQARYDLALAQAIEASDNMVNARNALAAVIGREVDALDPLADDFKARRAEALAFEEWQNIALASNPEIRMRRHVVESSREQVNQARAGHLPRLDLVASLGRSDSESINTFNQRATVRSVGVQLQVPLYAGGATSAATAQAVALQEKAQSDLDGKIGDVLVELRKQYNLATSSVARLQAATAATESARLAVEATQRSVVAGQRTNVDVLLAQQQWFEARRDLSQARYNYLLSVLRLRFAAGMLRPADLAEIATYFSSPKATGG